MESGHGILFTYDPSCYMIPLKNSVIEERLLLVRPVQVYRGKSPCPGINRKCVRLFMFMFFYLHIATYRVCSPNMTKRGLAKWKFIQ